MDDFLSDIYTILFAKWILLQEVPDFETKVNQAKKFLEGGDKLKVSVRFRKRAIAHPQLGEELLNRFKEACAAVGTVEKPAKMEGRSMVMFISPKASK